MEARALRSGAAYHTYKVVEQRKSILKPSKAVSPRVKLEHTNAVMLKSFKKALLLQKYLYGLSTDESKLLLFQASNSLKKYNAKNTFRMSKTIKKVSFANSGHPKQSENFSALLCLLNPRGGSLDDTQRLRFT